MKYSYLHGRDLKRSGGEPVPPPGPKKWPAGDEARSPPAVAVIGNLPMLPQLAGVGLDSRIGPKFLAPGPGWGGSCFPKDALALINLARREGYNFDLLEEVIRTNKGQGHRMVGRLRKLVGGSFNGVKIAAWGLSFKAGTDDTRETPAFRILAELAGWRRGWQGTVSWTPETYWTCLRTKLPASRSGPSVVLIVSSKRWRPSRLHIRFLFGIIKPMTGEKMAAKQTTELFESKTIRRVWVESEEKWFFSVVDVVAALSGSVDGRKYWKVLKGRLKADGSEVVTKCYQLKMVASDGKMYTTDAADTETMFRLIQSIPSPNAEPFKLWLARVGYERVEEVQDPEAAIDRALDHYRRLGYSDDWINQRLKSIEIRKDLTGEWGRVGVKAGPQYAVLTDDITRAWAGLSTRQYKQHKGLKKENLRDNMTNLELVLTMLAETATTEISRAKDPKTFQASRTVARKGGGVAGAARIEVEKQTQQSVISSKNTKQLRDGK